MNVMNKSTLMILKIITLFLVMPPALADWSKIGESENYNSTFYMDQTTIRRNGQFVRIWALINNSQRSTRADILSTKQQIGFECKEERFRILDSISFSGHMATGTVVVYTSENSKWESIMPASSIEVLFNLICHEWVKISENINGALYLDAATIRRNGQFVKVWLLTDLNQRGEELGIFSIRLQKEYDCKRRWSRYHEIFSHSNPMTFGEIVNNVRSTSEWELLSEEEKNMLLFVCL